MLFTHSIIYHRKLSSHRRPLHRRRLVKIRIDQGPPGFEAALHLPTSTPLPISHTRRAWTCADTRSRRVVHGTLWTAQDLMAMVSMTMAKRGLAVRIRTAVDHSRISKRICLPTNQSDPRSAQSRLALITKKASLVSTIRIAILLRTTRETWSVDSAQDPAQPRRRVSIVQTSSSATLPRSMA